MTGLYTMGFCAGGRGGGRGDRPLMAAFGVHGPCARLLGSARRARRGRVGTPLPPRDPAVVHAATRVRGLWADPLAWHVMLFMGLQSALAYTVMGWLPPMLRDRGLSPVDAGLVLSISVLVQAITCLFAPALATRGKDQKLANVLSMALCVVGLMGCFFAPLGTIWIGRSRSG